ncbi:M28 family peptidase [Natronorubrum sp. JWXQ-INN-674]|uniref:Carboxypeptidase Q n=1 Tax=Natronorubrum halalkaliphilum TaxID=2691917 RepID=A0A6B0VK52_9EURY|nr:M28 family metallopeptidase [Natronorubrum halalkaliphilum]MXV61934.1 M28 family peptidase [Natronorubrum halalkaliphilum]
MTKLPNDVVGDAYTSTYHWELLEDLVDIGNRMAGQEGERQGAERVRKAFSEIGLQNVHIDEFEIDGWWRGDAALSTSGVHEDTFAADYQVIGLPGTPSETVEAELVDVGYGRPADFAEADLEGNIAMASSETPDDHERRLHRMEKYVSAVDGGAVGFVFRNHVAGCLPATGEIGYDNRPGPIPAVGVSKEVGDRLLRHASDGSLRVELDVDARNERTESVNVIGEAGPDTDDVVMVTAHLDAHDIAEGANDNGAGTALVCEIARLLKRVEDDLETRVRFVPFGSEEIGLQGAAHSVATQDLSNVKCVINIDGAGNSRTLRVNANEFDGLRNLFEEITDEFDVPLVTDDTISPHGDQWAFVQEGVPASMTSSTSESSGRGWGHTHADTLDKLDVRDLRELSALIGSAAFTAAEDDREFAPRSRAETREMIDDGYVQELKIGGRWPYDE